MMKLRKLVYSKFQTYFRFRFLESDAKEEKNLVKHDVSIYNQLDIHWGDSLSCTVLSAGTSNHV